MITTNARPIEDRALKKYTNHVTATCSRTHFSEALEDRPTRRRTETPTDNDFHPLFSLLAFFSFLTIDTVHANSKRKNVVPVQVMVFDIKMAGMCQTLCLFDTALSLNGERTRSPCRFCMNFPDRVQFVSSSRERFSIYLPDLEVVVDHPVFHVFVLAACIFTRLWPSDQMPENTSTPTPATWCSRK